MPILWKNDDELFALARAELFTAVVGDIMDTLGARDQFLSPRLQPLEPGMKAVGRAMTVLERDTDPEEAATPAGKPFGLMLEALDDLRPNEIYFCSGASPTYALWGELMSARAAACGAAGAVVDGYSRDTEGILKLGFPTFSYGSYAQDQAPRGTVVDFRVPLKVGKVGIAPGDLLFADRDGVCVVPRNMETEVVTLALEKARGEKTVMKAIQAGMSARDAFAKYRIM
jgi:regulator of RNase E activity RraA